MTHGVGGDTLAPEYKEGAQASSGHAPRMVITRLTQPQTLEAELTPLRASESAPQ